MSEPKDKSWAPWMHRALDANERAEKAERELKALTGCVDCGGVIKRYAQERDAAMAELKAWRGFVIAAKERKSVAEVLSERLITVENERDAAIKAKEEATAAHMESMRRVAECGTKFQEVISELKAVRKRADDCAVRAMAWEEQRDRADEAEKELAECEADEQKQFGRAASAEHEAAVLREALTSAKNTLTRNAAARVYVITTAAEIEKTLNATTAGKQRSEEFAALKAELEETRLISSKNYQGQDVILADLRTVQAERNALKADLADAVGLLEKLAADYRPQNPVWGATDAFLADLKMRYPGILGS